MTASPDVRVDVAGDGTTILHASCVAVGRRGLLIMGASGSGKSALALQLMALGADLVADDRTVLCQRGEGLSARAPDAIAGMIEARFVGLLRAAVTTAAPVAAVDLDRAETTRLPPSRTCDVMGVRLPLFLRVDGPHFAAAMLQFLRAGSAPVPS